MFSGIEPLNLAMAKGIPGTPVYGSCFIYSKFYTYIFKILYQVQESNLSNYEVKDFKDILSYDPGIKYFEGP